MKFVPNLGPYSEREARKSGHVGRDYGIDLVAVVEESRVDARVTVTKLNGYSHEIRKRASRTRNHENTQPASPTENASSTQTLYTS